jgi:hypothetical protein
MTRSRDTDRSEQHNIFTAAPAAALAVETPPSGPIFAAPAGAAADPASNDRLTPRLAASRAAGRWRRPAAAGSALATLAAAALVLVTSAPSPSPPEQRRTPGVPIAPPSLERTLDGARAAGTARARPPHDPRPQQRRGQHQRGPTTRRRPRAAAPPRDAGPPAPPPAPVSPPPPPPPAPIGPTPATPAPPPQAPEPHGPTPRPVSPGALPEFM